MKKTFAFTMAVFLILVFAISVSITASAAGTISTNKTNYEVGEEIKVTATGENKDWVGLYKKGEVPGTIVSIFWYYCISDSTNSGDTVVINQSANSGGREGFSGGILPEGEYTIYLFENNGYTVLRQIDIVVGAPASADSSQTSSSQTSSSQASQTSSAAVNSSVSSSSSSSSGAVLSSAQSTSSLTAGTSGSNNPKTGDMSAAYYVAALVLLVSVINVALIRKKRKPNNL